MFHSRIGLVFKLIALGVIGLIGLAALYGGAYSLALLIIFPFLVLVLFLGSYPFVLALLPRSMWDWESKETKTAVRPKATRFKPESIGLNPERANKDKKAA